MSKKAIAIVLASSISLSSCQTTNMGDGETLGTVLGAVGGAVLGSQFGKGTGQLFGTAIGTLAGAYIGNQLGKILDEKEQAQVQTESVDALENSTDGQTVAWTNPDTGAKAQIQATNTRQVKQKVTVYRSREIAALPTLDLIGEEYQSIKNANVRNAPTTDADVVSGLKAGENFTAVGKVEGKPWIVVARNNRTVGYVYETLVQKATQQSDAYVATSQVLRKKDEFDEQAAKLKEEGKGQSSFGEPIDLDAEGLVAEEIEVATTCRDLGVNVQKGDQTGEDSFTACKATDGAWEIM